MSGDTAGIQRGHFWALFQCGQLCQRSESPGVQPHAQPHQHPQTQQGPAAETPQAQHCRQGGEGCGGLKINLVVETKRL